MVDEAARNLMLLVRLIVSINTVVYLGKFLSTQFCAML